MATHTKRRGSLAQRDDVYYLWDTRVRKGLAKWAADPKTTIPQLRGALEEALRSAPEREWDSCAIKAAYLAMMRSLEQPVPLRTQQDVGWEYHLSFGEFQLPPETGGYLDAACRFLLREPERSRRVMRLLYANWLAHVERQEPGPQQPAVVAALSLLKSTNPMSWGTTTVSLYPVGPLAPAGARSLPPRDLARWLVATNDAKLRIIASNSPQGPWSPDRLRDCKDHRALVVMLAEEIYLRERGSRPPSEDALLGTYLKSLPDDGSGDRDDGTAPTVE
jgi:hypothetical protein